MFSLFKWWFSTPSAWYSVCVSSPATGHGDCAPYRWMTRSAAIDWMLNIREENWNADVDLLQWNGKRWVSV